MSGYLGNLVSGSAECALILSIACDGGCIAVDSLYSILIQKLTVGGQF